jgi:IS30 family transposase
VDPEGSVTLRIAQLKKGETNAAIAARLGCVASTVERKLRWVRDLWTREGIA